MHLSARYHHTLLCRLGLLFISLLVAHSGGLLAAWVQLTPPVSRTSWSEIACSGDGLKMAAVVDSGMIWTSADGGGTWTARAGAGVRNWKSVAVSADGSRIMAIEVTSTENVVGGIVSYLHSSGAWLSVDGGTTWTLKTSQASRWNKVAISPDGSKVAVACEGEVWISVDGGTTWVRRVVPAPAPASGGFTASLISVIVGPDSPFWTSVAFSGNGARLWLVGKANGVSAGHNLWVSDDDGSTWAERPNPIFLFNGKMAVSADGSKALTTLGHGSQSLWATEDGGETWSRRNGVGSHIWTATAMSADGTVQVAAATSGGLWVSTDSGSSWVQRQTEARHDWSSVCCSSDGSRLAAVAADGNIWTSADSGTTWQRHDSAGGDFIYAWRALAMSEDGRRLAVAEGGGSLWTLDHRGVSWDECLGAGQRYWRSIADSADGSRLVAAGQEISSSSLLSPGNVWTSPDQGQIWDRRDTAGKQNWKFVTASSDGQRLAAAVDIGLIHTSEDGGATWTARTGPGSLKWTGLSASRDGQRLVVADATLPGKVSYEKLGSIRASQDGGATWKELTQAGKRHWTAITSSGDGRFLAATLYGGGIYTSEDYGTTWVLRTGAGSRLWSAIACSADGIRLAAAATWDEGGIWASADSGRTWQESAGTRAKQWAAIQMSADGSRLAAVADTGGLWVNDLVVTLGGSTLTAPAAPAAGTTVYQWFKEGVAIRGATSSSFTPVAGLPGAGSYYVKMTTTVQKGVFTEVSLPIQVTAEDRGLLIYKLTATATAYAETLRASAAVTGYLVVDRIRQRGGLIWQRTYGRQKTHTQELLEDLRIRSTGPVPKSQTVISDLQIGGTESVPGDDAVLWLNGADSLVTLRPAGVLGAAMQTLAPTTLAGQANLVVSSDLGATIWRIETSAVNAALDIPATTGSRALMLEETVESALQRLSQQLSNAGSILRHE